MRDFLSWRGRSAIMLAEANVPPEESLKYFGEYGDNLQMMLNFPVNQRLWYALATADTGPLRWALQHTAKRPADAQWVNFLRSHDECDLGRLSPEQRAQVFAALAPATMQLYDRGSGARWRPARNDRAARAGLTSLLAPGTPMILRREIGWARPRADERECARRRAVTSEKHGASPAARARAPRTTPDYGYRRSRRIRPRAGIAPEWWKRRIRMRKEAGFGDGDSRAAHGHPEVLVIREHFRACPATLHNFSNRAKTVVVEPRVKGGNVLTDVFDENHSRTENGTHQIKMPAYGHRWMRVGAIDNALNRTPF